MDLPGLEAFVLTVREGGVTRAAERLGLTQPAVSARLRALERQLGQALLRRRGRRLELTPAGAELLARAEPLVALAEDLGAWLRDAGRLAAGRLRIGADGPFGVMPLIAAFRSRYPRVTVELRIGNTAQVAAELRQGITDAAVVMASGEQDLVTVTLSQERLCALLPASHPLADGRPVGLAQLVREPLILRERGSLTRALLEAAIARAGLRVRLELELGSREAVREAVAAGLGVGVVFEGEQPADARLVVTAVPELATPVPRVLACLPARRHLRVTSALFALAARLPAATHAPRAAGTPDAP